jgi:hypothetical protein
MINERAMQARTHIVTTQRSGTFVAAVQGG